MKKSILLELWLAVLTYVVIGAAIFRFLELPKEKEMQAIMKETREKFLRLHPCVSRSSFRVLVQNVVTSVTVGMDPGAYFTNKTRSTWTTEGAIFFAGSLVTTVGYGNVILLSDEGRIFCVFFIVLGIPLYGMLLTSTGEHVGTNLQARISTMENFLTKRQLLGTVMVRFLASIFFIGIGFLFFVALPVVIFITLENWSEVESFFYVIVTLTTVGFGDFVPGTNPVNTFWGYQYLVLLWIVLSLFYFASIITMIGNWIRQEMNNLEEVEKLSQSSNLMGRAKEPSRRFPRGSKVVPAPSSVTTRSMTAPSTTSMTAPSKTSMTTPSKINPSKTSPPKTFPTKS
uniref:Potassium two pore domain channel subfamily K member 4 n=1 Tax=Monodelphis domestica TaxID=13616 RepID=K7E277_MONDO